LKKAKKGWEQAALNVAHIDSSLLPRTNTRSPDTY